MANILTDYNTYKMNIYSKILYFIQAAVFIYLFAYMFYRNHLISAFLCIFAGFYPGIKTAVIIRRRKNALSAQFKDMLYCLSSSISTGKPVETSFKDALRDLKVIYPQPEVLIVKEVEIIIRRMEMGETVESAISDLANRSHNDDIENFSSVFKICKRTGGNLAEIMKNTSNIISDRIEISSELETLIAQKKFEQKLLNIIPAFIIIFISVFSKDYIEPVYNTVAGRLVMTVSALLWLTAWLVSSKITDIRL
jgi:tight adherence protein B